MGNNIAERELFPEERARPATMETLVRSSLPFAANRIFP